MPGHDYKEDINDYGIIHTKDKLGFDILDRNSGASKNFDQLDENASVLTEFNLVSGNSTGFCVMAGHETDSTNHSCIPKSEGNLNKNLCLL